MSRSSSIAGLGLLVLLSGCPSNSDPSSKSCVPTQARTGSTPLPAEIDAVLDAKCRLCHSDPTRMYAPMPLVSWEDFHDFAPSHTDGPAIYELVQDRIHDAKYPMPPKTLPQLSDEERATLDAWLDQCAPPREN